MKTSPHSPIKPLAEPWILLSKYYHRIANATVVFLSFLFSSLFSSLSIRAEDFPFFSFAGVSSHTPFLRFKPSVTLVLVDTGVEIASKDFMFHRPFLDI
jgi:hypothetical protein